MTTEVQGRGLRIRRDISIENVVGFLAILLSLITFLVSQDRDRELAIKAQAQALRASGSDTLAQISRIEELSGFFFLQLEPLAVVASQNLAETKNVEGARDILWQRTTEVFVSNEERFNDSRFSESYFAIAAAFPRLHDEIERAMTMLREERRRAFVEVQSRSEVAVLSFAGHL